MSSSDSNSDEEDLNRFKGVCDPDYAFINKSPKHGSDQRKAADESLYPITGEVEFDKTIHTIKKRLNSGDKYVLNHSIHELKCLKTGRFVRSGSHCMKHSANPYLLRELTKYLSSQVEVRGSFVTSREARAPQELSALTLSPLTLLPGIIVCASQTDPKREKVPTRAGLDLLKRRYNPCFYFDTDEKEIERRCKEVAISGFYIAQGGLTSRYTEFKNRDPRKLERIQIINNCEKQWKPTNSLEGCSMDREKSNIGNNCPTEMQNKRVTFVSSKKISDYTEKEKKTKSRKRGPKKKKSLPSESGNVIQN